MKFLPLVWKNVWRRKFRTAFTLLSVFIAFLLFGILMTIRESFDNGVQIAGLDRLVLINKVSLNLGLWSSIHSRHTDAGLIGGGSTGTRSWYEFDYTVGIATTFAKNFTFTPSFFAFLSPNDGFSDFYGLNLNVAYSDASWWGDSGFSLNPYVTVLFELQNKAGTGADEGIYYEVGITPTKAFGDVTVSLPIKAGFGSDDFYGSLDESSGAIRNEGFGFVSAGLNVAVPLKFIPECLGTWTVNANATSLF